MRRVLVTGGAGFIGSHTVDLLLNQDIEVVVIDNLSSGKLSYLNLFNPKLRFVQGDVCDVSLLRREIGRCDTVLHLAAIVSVPQSIENPIKSLHTNLQGFVSVLEAIRHHHNPPRLVYASSAAVYGDSTVLPCSDENTLDQDVLSPYALEKATNESYAALYARSFGIKSLGLRYFNVYGDRQDPSSPYSGVISKFVGQYQKNEPLLVHGTGEQSRDFIHVSDVARANILALQNNATGVLNIASGKSENLLHLIAYMEKALQRKLDITFMKKRKGDILHSYATVAKAANALNFRYTMSLDQGIQTMIKPGDNHE